VLALALVRVDARAAIDAWTRSADAHECEGKHAHALACLLRVAELRVGEGEFAEARKAYLRVVDISIDANVNRASLREYFYGALLCQFVLSARKGTLRKLEALLASLTNTDRKFIGTWHERIVRQCMCAFENGDVQEFAQAVSDQNAIRPLDELSIRIMLEVKRCIQLSVCPV
jgi:hypothetical protein